MTIVLGDRPAARKRSKAAQRRAAWIKRFQEPTVCHVHADGPLPVPMAEIALHAPAIRRDGIRTTVSRKDGVISLYAHREDQQRIQRMVTTRHRQPQDPPRPIRIGRGTADHYARLYPHRDLPTVHLPAPARPDAARPLTSLRRTIRAINLGLQGPRMATPRHALLASLAALLIMSGAAISTQAQQRYEVRPGDTIESIAAEFGVDPDGIYRSSYMPNGWSVEAGQVVIIPDQGQTPAEAAEAAAANEGTSPWVQGAHWVEYGDTYASIAAEWGVDVDTLIAFNQQMNPTSLIPGERVLIPWDRDTVAAGPAVEPAAAAPAGVMLPVPNFAQTHTLSCEYAATYAATAAFGPGISEATFLAETPLAANPHMGYRGNIDGQWGNTDDYGVYPEALIPTLNRYGYVGEVMYTHGDPAPLIAQLDAGHPVAVWLGFWGDTREVKTDDGQYSVFAGMHVVTVMGYDDDGVTVMDPAKGAQTVYSWDRFISLWRVIDGMGLAVYPM